MRKRLGSRIAFISALTMLATEVLSPVAVIAAEDVVAESEYVEAFSQEDAYEEAADDAEVEDVQADDSESVEINGEEDAVEEDVVGAAVSGSIDLYNGDVWVGENKGDEPGVITLETKTAQAPGGDPLEYKVVNVLSDGNYHVYNDSMNMAENIYIDVAPNINASFTFGGVSVENENLANALGKGKSNNDDSDSIEGAALIQAGAGSKVNIILEPGEGMYGNYVSVAGGGFINQKGSNSVVNVSIKDGGTDGSLEVSNLANIWYTLISTEGTLNMNSGNLEFYAGTTAIDIKGGTLNVNGGYLNINGFEHDSVVGKGGTVNVKEGSRFYITEAEDDCIRIDNDGDKAGHVNISGGESYFNGFENGIVAENVEISDGEVDIEIDSFNDEILYYTEGTESRERNTLSLKDGVFTDRVFNNPGSHKGIKAGEKAKTVKFYDGEKADITVPASGSVKISGGTINIANIQTGIKMNKIEEGYPLDRTDAGIYMIGTPDDTIYSGKDVEISGGDVYLYSADRGITAGETVTITKDADVQIPNCYEGIEGKLIKIGEKDDTTDGPRVIIGSFDEEANPDIKPRVGEFYCLDDGICASSVTITENYDSYDIYTGERYPQYIRETALSAGGDILKTYSGKVDIYIDSKAEKNEYSYYIGGGQFKFYPCGDGIDCNGTYDDRGGFVRVYGDADDNIPFKTNNDFIFTNGPWMLGTGTDKDGKSLPTAGSGVYLVWGGKTGDVPTGSYEDDVLGDGEFSFKAKDKFVVKDSKDQVIYEDELPFSGTFIIFGSPDLKAGEKYKVAVGDKEPKEFTGLRKNETDPEETPDNIDEPEEAGKDKDPSISVNNVLGYTVSYNSSISYNGAKIYLPYFVFDGAKVGGTISNNTIIFKKIKYKNNKFVGKAQMRLQFKAAKTKKDGTKFSKEEKAKIKAEVKKLNDYFKKNYLTFDIVPRQLLASEIVEVKGTYKAKKGKFSIKLRVDTKATNAKGKALKPIKVKEVKKSGKGDFEIDPKSFKEKEGTVVLKGKNNFTGTCIVKGIVAK